VDWFGWSLPRARRASDRVHPQMRRLESSALSQFHMVWTPMQTNRNTKALRLRSFRSFRSPGQVGRLAITEQNANRNCCHCEECSGDAVAVFLLTLSHVCFLWLLPASAEGLVELNEASVFVAAAFVAKRRDANRLLQIGYCILLSQSDLMEFFVPDQSVGDVAESALDRLPVGDQGLLVLGFGQSQISAECATCKDGLAHLCTIKTRCRPVKP
jgi:hypothetical protein